MTLDSGETVPEMLSEDNASNSQLNSITKECNAGTDIDNECDEFGPLLKYAHDGDWQSTENFLREHPRAIRAKIGPFSLTVLHVAVVAGHEEMVKKLVELMPTEALSIGDSNGETALHYAATGGCIQMATYLIDKDPNLVRNATNNQNLPLSLACNSNQREMSAFLLSKTPLEVLTTNQDHGSLFLQTCITTQMLDIALKAIDDHPSLVAAKYSTTNNNASLYSLSKTPALFPSAVQLGYWQRWIYSCIHIPPVTDSGVQDQRQWQCKLHGVVIKSFLKFLGINQLYDLKMTHAYSSRLLDCVCQYLSTLTEKECTEIGIYESFNNAVKFGIVEVVIKIVKVQPHLLDTIIDPDTTRDLVMTSVVNRHEKIFNLFYGLTTVYKGKKMNFCDKFDNTLLHLASMLSPSNALARIPGAALQMQRELQWYKEVESIVNPTVKCWVNTDGETPNQLFSKSHIRLVKEGEEWMKGTATSYTVVGALIITIMFTAAFTVPGGNIGDIGIPVFLHKKAFITFIVSDATSLFASTTSVLMFLGILTSRYAEQDFLESLPKKLIIGLSALFISIATMMVAFCAALIITLNGMLNVIIPIVVLACIPVTLFMFLQFPVLVEIVMSTYGPGIFDRKMKRWY